MTTETEAPPPLEGITVIGLEQAVAAPFATRQLADLGARVIKIERVGEGDFGRAYDQMVNGLSSHFVWLNRTKESLTLDVKDPRGRAVLDALLARADVFVTNLSYDALARLELGQHRLREQFPRLIACAVTGYPPDGDERARRAYDLLVQAESGVAAVTGTPEHPVKVGISIADIAAGMYAFSGVLTALYVRERTGIARPVAVDLFDALTEWGSQPLYAAAHTGVDPARRALHHPSIVPYGPVETADGAIVIVAVQNPAEWRRFCSGVLDQPDLADDPRFATNVARTANREGLEEQVALAARKLSAAELTARLEAADLPYGTLRTPTEALAALRARSGPLPVVPTAAGPVEIFARAMRIEGAPVLKGVPSLGENTDAILSELGYGDDAIAELRRAGVV